MAKKHYVHRVSDDKLFADLKETIKSSFDGEVEDVKLITETFCQIHADLYDRNGNFIKRFILTDFDCEESFNKESKAPNYISNCVDCSVLKKAWVRFLKDHYPDYREDFLNNRKVMAELEIGK